MSRRRDRSEAAYESIEEWIDALKAQAAGNGHDNHGETVARLWAGYGSVVRVQADINGTQRSLIWKRINPPPIDGSIGDARKRESYKNEAIFYQSVANKLTGKSVPKSYYVQAIHENGYIFLLEDLSEMYPRYADSLCMSEALVALDWLATFHAYFWGAKDLKGLTHQGSYWYLDTRREEFDRISTGTTTAKNVVKWAEDVDKWLKNCAFKTVIHGDFKSENLLLNEDGSTVAAVDYQYCGMGPPMRDVVYFLHTSVDRRVLHQSDKLLDHYHRRLVSLLEPKDRQAFTMDVMRKQYMLCVIDWYRFTLGWGMWGSDPSYTAQVAAEGLQNIESLLT